MKTLLEQLTEATKSFKEEYINKTKDWADNYYDILLKRSHYKDVDWCKLLGLEPRVANPGTANEFLSFPKGFFSTKGARKYDRLKNEVSRAIRIGKEEFIKKEINKADNHFKKSIIKLAGRIEKKQLDKSNIIVEHAHVGVNLEMTLTDGDKSVKAWTIIASGPIQRPHYRYLVK
jgi:hypothetical protein